MSKVLQFATVGAGGLAALYYGQVCGFFTSIDANAKHRNPQFARIPPYMCPFQSFSLFTAPRTLPTTTLLSVFLSSLQVAWQIYESHSESRLIEGQLKSQVQAADAAEAMVRRETEMLSTLQERWERSKEAIEGLDSKLDAARKKVIQLESEHRVLIKEAEEASEGIGQAKNRLVGLAAEIQHRRENAAVSLARYWFRW